MLPQLDVSTYIPQIVWLILSFGTLLMFVRFYVVPRFEQILFQRAKNLQSIRAEIVRLEQEINDLEKKRKNYLEETQRRIRERAENDFERQKTFFQERVFEMTRDYNLRLEQILADLENQASVLESSISDKIPTLLQSFEPWRMKE